MLRAGMLGLGLAACSSAVALEVDRSDTALMPFGNRAVDRTLVAGTLVEATIHGPLSWRGHAPGESLRATASGDVRNARRWIVIPAESPIGLRVAPLGLPAGSQADARLLVDVTSVTVWGQVYPVSATVALSRAAVEARTPILFVLSEGLTVERRPRRATARLAASASASK